jgi:hypothetical protein
MKKDKPKSKSSNRRNDKKSGTARKQAGPRAPQRPGDTLTCSEAQVEALLSEGEST